MSIVREKIVFWVRGPRWMKHFEAGCLVNSTCKPSDISTSKKSAHYIA